MAQSAAANKAPVKGAGDTVAAPAAPAAVKRKKERSPPYPSITFKEALEKAKKLFDKEKKLPTAPDVIARHLGYKSANNGAFIPTLSALKKYGLLVGADGDDMRLSDDAFAVFVHPEGAPERLAILKRLAMMPSIFQAVMQKYPNGLPSDESLRTKLQLDFGFKSQEAADTLIRALRASVALAGLDLPGGQEQDDGAANGTEEPSLHATPTIQNPIQTTNPPDPRHPAKEIAKSHERHVWKLGDGVWAEIVVNGALTEKRLQRLKKYIELLDFDEDEETRESPHPE